MSIAARNAAASDTQSVTTRARLQANSRAERDFLTRGGARQAGECHALPRGTELSGLCDDEVCVPYKRKSTTPDRLKRQKVGSDSEAL